MCLEANGMKNVDAITYQVTNDKNAMPAFGGRFSDSDIEDVANYVYHNLIKVGINFF